MVEDVRLFGRVGDDQQSLGGRVDDFLAGVGATAALDEVCARELVGTVDGHVESPPRLVECRQLDPRLDRDLACLERGRNTLDIETGVDLATDVRGDLCLAGAAIGDDLRIAGSRIEGGVVLSRVECQGGLLFDANNVGRDVWCVGTTVHSNSDSGNLLSKNEVGNDLRIKQSQFAGKLSLEKTLVESELVVESTTVESRWLDFTNCDIHAGLLKQPADGHVKYDFTEATMGNIELHAESGNRFEFCRFENTTFERFDFGRHRMLLHRSDWTIHTVGDDASAERGLFGLLERAAGKLRWLKDSLTSAEPTELRDHVVNETTYLKAKNGANRMGDNKAAAEFFIKEMGFRRRRHAETALNGRGTDEGGPLTRIRAAGAWVANVGLSATTGYGEKPHRVLLSAGVIIAVFAVFYGTVPSDHYVSDVGVAEALLLSFQSCGTFIRGEAPADNSFLLRVTSTFEGLIGAFLVALSVFALTRSVHR